MKDIASEFINNKILERQADLNVGEFINWPSFLSGKFLSRDNLLKEFSENYKPTQNQIDFVRSVSLHHIFKLFKKNKEFLKNIPKECLSIIDKNIEKFPQIEKASYGSPDNIRFEPILNLNLLKINSASIVDLISLINKIEKKDRVLFSLKETIESELDLINKRVKEIEDKLKEIPDILVKDLRQTTKYNISDKPRASVITCSYNLAKLVEETLRSVANQDYDNFEHIVVDGGSTDGSVELIKKYPDIVLISEKDTGFPDAFWKGLRIAKGEYILQCCISDGYTTTEWVRKCVEILDKNKDISLVWGFPQHLTENSRPRSICYSRFHYNEAPQKQEMFNHWLKTSFFYPEGNLCVRKSVMLKCYPTVEECKKGILDWLEFSHRFNSLGYVSMHLPILANFGRTHSNQSGEQQKKEGGIKIRADHYFKKVTRYKIKLLTGLVRHDFIDSERNKIDLKFDRKKFVIEDIIRDFFRIDKKYFQPKKYFYFIKRKIFR